MSHDLVIKHGALVDGSGLPPIAPTIVNGETLMRDGKHTGALPGQLLRGPLAPRA